MQYALKIGTAEKQRTGCVIVGVFDRRKLSSAAAAIDRASRGEVTRWLKHNDLSANHNGTLMLIDLPQINAEAVLLVGCGAEKELDAMAYRGALTKAAQALVSNGITDAVSYLTELDVRGDSCDLYWKIRQGIEVTEQALYRFEQTKSKKDVARPKLRRLQFAVASRSGTAPLQRAVRESQAIANGVKLARDLGNLPGNICTPGYLADQARALAKRFNTITTRVLERKDMEKLGMGALLSVARGSEQPPKLIVLEYKGPRADGAPVALVGKGVTFDSGGISLKPAQAMDEMKFDMCGAASVLGTMLACARLRPPIRVVGVIPAAENLPGGNASKPGDVVTSLSGQTVEVLNTDAEGRLILCDALTYSERYQPEVTIDIATLTGACVIALGKHASGLLTNDENLAAALLNAAGYSCDRAWRLPLWKEYQDQLKSNFADFANIGGREAGTITAACFLERFTRGRRWAHLDIAGTAWLGGDQKGATGRPVPLLCQFLLDRAGQGD